MLFSLFLDTFSCSKDFAVSLFPDTFRNQGILMFCLFSDTFRTFSCSKDFDVLPVFRHFSYSRDFDVLPVLSKHLKGRSAPRVSDVFADSKGFVIFLFSLFPDIFCVQRILLFPCFQTL